MDLNFFIKTVQPYSMTSIERITELYNSLEYLRLNNIDGDIVECGVWKGGNILGIMEYLYHHKIDKKIWLYDTFEGMTSPEEIDSDLNNNQASNMMHIPIVLAYSPISEVKQNLEKSKFNKDNLNFVIGDVSVTLLDPTNIPKKISLLRLDTDWYKSTKDELYFLYPNLIDNGILIVDDYGHWRGSKQAVDEYFNDKNILIERIDYTGIKIVK
jgi:O-methyltransferase